MASNFVASFLVVLYPIFLAFLVVLLWRFVEAFTRIARSAEEAVEILGRNSGNGNRG
jgi:hypothetical protein